MTNESILAERYQSLALSVAEAEYGISLLKDFIARYSTATDTDLAVTVQDKINALESLADCTMVNAEQIRLDIDRLIRVLQGQNQ